MEHLIWHTFKDVLKIIPFLYLAFILIEFIEHKLNKKNKNILTKYQKYGPLTGGLLGMIPQCGFSALATNLFSSKVITVGTLIAVYLSTSDEMLAIFLTGGMPLINALGIIVLKACIGIVCGVFIDLISKNKSTNVVHEIEEMCDQNNCHCHNNLFVASLKHTFGIALYIFIATFLINLLLHHVDSDTISKILFQGRFLSYFMASLIGLIPNCASSVMISELYINEIISFGNMMSGLLTGAGIGILILFRTNKNLKQNLLIVFMIYIIGVVFGILIDLLGFSL